METSQEIHFIFLGDTLARQLTQYDLTGITPEELQKKTVADITKQNLDIIFIGINPGYHSALTGHHYSGSGTFFFLNFEFLAVKGSPGSSHFILKSVSERDGADIQRL